MDRRKFLCRVTAATAASTAGGLESSASAAAKEPLRVTYNVRGFTCITCAVGLEVMLRGLTGVTRANASYPAHNAVIEFDQHIITEKKIKEFIETCGFSVS